MVDVLSAGTVLLQIGLAGFLVDGTRRRNASTVANALVALGATFLPALVEYAIFIVHGVTVSIEGIVPLWIAAAGVLHMAGMWGLYENEATWWWDHVTHVVSAALVAATFYGILHGFTLASSGFQPSPAAIAGLTVLLTLAVGVMWELVEIAVHRYSAELGVESVLIPYGHRDTALDLAFDVVGAVLVVVLDLQLLVPLVVEVPWLTRLFLVGTGAFVVMGSIGSSMVILLVGGPGAGTE